MIYTSYSLNGTWEMYYKEEKYTDMVSPFQVTANETSYIEAGGQGNFVIEQAVPGYWEDMTEAFQEAPFFRNLKINPEYGIQQYPIAGNAPDMALPNIIGNFFYRRGFVWGPEYDGAGRDTVLHFEGVQNAVSVWLNDVFLGRHEGYSAPFEIKIPEDVLRDGENILALSVSNHRLAGYAGEPVSGLTSRAANECTGGITGNVELRVYNSPIRDAVTFVSPDCKKVSVTVVTSQKEEKSSELTTFLWRVCDNGEILKSGESKGDFSFDTCGLECWSPENPQLYTLEIVCGDGLLVRTFGVRRLLAEGVHFRLNGTPYYLRGICEHCYFPETVHPNHDGEYYRSMIRSVKKLGFNFIRFHTWVPEEEYLQAADELGMLIQVECPNNTTLDQWEEIVHFCRRHPSVVIYCCGNELLLDDPFISYLSHFGKYVHGNTDALFSPMSAMRGVEYFWTEPDQEAQTRKEPLKHHPRRIKELSEFCDLFSSYTNGQHSYTSLDGDPETVDAWNCVYNKPRVSHEICIDGTYADLSLKDRYKGTRIGKTEMFSSIETHLEKKGLLKKAPLYFKHSSEWQRRVRKYCFETVRRSHYMAGYDFLGPIDTHWHTFGYDVGMMNEFYELKPGETVRNVLMYNSATVLLHDLGKRTNFAGGETLRCTLSVSHYGKVDLEKALLNIRLSLDGSVLARRQIQVEQIKRGMVAELCEFSFILPETDKPKAMKLYVTLDGGDTFAENEWELYLFPGAEENQAEQCASDLILSEGMDLQQLANLLAEGKDVLLLGAEPFAAMPLSFRIALAGRTGGNLATVIKEHPVLNELPHEGFCGWQFAEMMEGGQAVCFESEDVPFDPVIEVASVHKYGIRQAAMFEFEAINGRLLVCGLRFKETDPAARWLRKKLVAYMQSAAFCPKDTIDEQQLHALAAQKVKKAEKNTNLAFNMNDKTAVRRSGNYLKRI